MRPSPLFFIANSPDVDILRGRRVILHQKFHHRLDAQLESRHKGLSRLGQARSEQIAFVRQAQRDLSRRRMESVRIRLGGVPSKTERFIANIKVDIRKIYIIARQLWRVGTIK